MSKPSANREPSTIPRNQRNAEIRTRGEPFGRTRSSPFLQSHHDFSINSYKKRDIKYPILSEN